MSNEVTPPARGLTSDQEKEVAKRLQDWPYWKLVGAVLGLQALGFLDIGIPDFVPFLDEAMIEAVVMAIVVALGRKTLGDLKRLFRA